MNLEEHKSLNKIMKFIYISNFIEWYYSDYIRLPIDVKIEKNIPVFQVKNITKTQMANLMETYIKDNFIDKVNTTSSWSEIIDMFKNWSAYSNLNILLFNTLLFLTLFLKDNRNNLKENIDKYQNYIEWLIDEEYKNILNRFQEYEIDDEDIKNIIDILDNSKNLIEAVENIYYGLSTKVDLSENERYKYIKSFLQILNARWKSKLQDYFLLDFNNIDTELFVDEKNKDKIQNAYGSLFNKQFVEKYLFNLIISDDILNELWLVKKTVTDLAKKSSNFLKEYYKENPKEKDILDKKQLNKYKIEDIEVIKTTNHVKFWKTRMYPVMYKDVFNKKLFNFILKNKSNIAKIENIIEIKLMDNSRWTDLNEYIIVYEDKENKKHNEILFYNSDKATLINNEIRQIYFTNDIIKEGVNKKILQLV